jgi:hypothetical protein
MQEYKPMWERLIPQGALVLELAEIKNIFSSVVKFPKHFPKWI